MITANPKYKELYDTDKRYILITGGRGSGKSFEVGRFTSILSFEPNHKILFTRQTMSSAHLSIIPEFQEKIELLEFEDAFEINRSEIKNKKKRYLYSNALKFISSIRYIPSKLLASRACLCFYLIVKYKKNNLTQFRLHSLEYYN